MPSYLRRGANEHGSWMVRLSDSWPRLHFHPLQALQPPEEASPMPLVNEVAVSVFGRDLLEGAPPGHRELHG